jgi:hypothetical protein
MASPLKFNVSHSDGVALVAISHGVAVGIDVEAIRPMADANQIAARLFRLVKRPSFEGCRPRRSSPVGPGRRPVSRRVAHDLPPSPGMPRHS